MRLSEKAQRIVNRTAALLLLIAATIAGGIWAERARIGSKPSPGDQAAEPHKVTYCDLAKDPAIYNHALVRLTAFVTHGFEDFHLAEPNCVIPKQHLSIWVTYGGKAGSNTVYCCPGEADRGMRAEPLIVEGVQIPLIGDTVFQQFSELLNKERDTTVRATLVGRFFSGEKETTNGSKDWRGFGHMGCCGLFVIQQVEAFEPHTKTDADYTAEAGWYEKGGCNSGSMQYLKHVSISDSDGTAEHTIAEQELAETGARAWAFSDPRRVAVESLKPFYDGQAPVLRRVIRTPARVVFLWKNGKMSVVVVVTKPYWLSFYSKSGSVAWVSTTIKALDCN
jgi:hypothetical protein